MIITGIIAEFNPFHNGHEVPAQTGRRAEDCGHVWEFLFNVASLPLLTSGHVRRWLWKMERI